MIISKILIAYNFSTEHCFKRHKLWLQDTRIFKNHRKCILKLTVGHKRHLTRYCSIILLVTWFYKVKWWCYESWLTQSRRVQPRPTPFLTPSAECCDFPTPHSLHTLNQLTDSSTPWQLGRCFILCRPPFQVPTSSESCNPVPYWHILRFVVLPNNKTPSGYIVFTSRTV